MAESKKLQGKVAVITGGTEGIGFATAKLFAKEGAYVFITGRRQKELDEAANAIGSNAAGIQGDIADLDDLESTLFSPTPGLANLFPSGRSPRSISTSSSTPM
jgi:NAD(P)-dependent dehydrogenase (short-subunit alcohol dehydrogenase family)